MSLVRANLCWLMTPNITEKNTIFHYNVGLVIVVSLVFGKQAGLLAQKLLDFLYSCGMMVT